MGEGPRFRLNPHIHGAACLGLQARCRGREAHALRLDPLGGSLCPICLFRSVAVRPQEGMVLPQDHIRGGGLQRPSLGHHNPSRNHKAFTPSLCAGGRGDNVNPSLQVSGVRGGPFQRRPAPVLAGEEAGAGRRSVLPFLDASYQQTQRWLGALQGPAPPCPGRTAPSAAPACWDRGFGVTPVPWPLWVIPGDP